MSSTNKSSISVGNLKLSPPVFLAPMAGITDLPFRNVVSSFGAGLVVSEMIASHEMVQGRQGTREKAELGFSQNHTSVQIAGRDAFWMAEAAKMIEANGAKIIDINMGCPAKTVTHGLSGSALMRTPDFALTLIEAVVGATKLPVTLKMRLGWDHDCMNAADIARRAEDAGVQMITVHGRTRCQFYKGQADWGAIKSVVQAVRIPVIANGDIVDSQSAKVALEKSGADGVMVGRGIQGAPWRLAEIAADIWQTSKPEIPTGGRLAKVVVGHYEAMLSFYGEQLGNRVARKHLGWYLQKIDVDPKLRKEILTEKRNAQVVSLLLSVFQDAQVGKAA